MQISGFSADFFFLLLRLLLPHGSRPRHQPNSPLPKWQHWQTVSPTDSRHGIWSAPNLSQWYADKTNKYQVSLFLFSLRSCFCFFFLYHFAALLRHERV